MTLSGSDPPSEKPARDRGQSRRTGWLTYPAIILSFVVLAWALYNPWRPVDGPLGFVAINPRQLLPGCKLKLSAAAPPISSTVESESDLEPFRRFVAEATGNGESLSLEGLNAGIIVTYVSPRNDAEIVVSVLRFDTEQQATPIYTGLSEPVAGGQARRRFPSRTRSGGRRSVGQWDNIVRAIYAETEIPEGCRKSVDDAISRALASHREQWKGQSR